MGGIGSTSDGTTVVERSGPPGNNVSTSSVPRNPMPQSQIDSDAAMARAIAESMSTNSMGRVESEQDELARAIAASKNMNQANEREVLRQQQEMELRESELMDQMREQEAGKEAAEAAEVQRAIDEQRAVEQSEKENRLDSVRRASAALPAEPDAAVREKMGLMFKFPNGKSVRRKFLNAQPTADLYTFVDSQLLEFAAQNGGNPEFEAMAGGGYALHCTFPRMMIEKSPTTDLVAARLEDQTAIMVQSV